MTIPDRAIDLLYSESAVWCILGLAYLGLVAAMAWDLNNQAEAAAAEAYVQGLKDARYADCTGYDTHPADLSGSVIVHLVCPKEVTE